MATISLDADVEILLSTMRNPLKANICASKLKIAVGHIHNALNTCTSIATNVKFAKSHPEFLRAGIRFLTFKQSVPDQLKMMDHLSTCHCNPDKRCLYDPARYKTRQQNPIFTYDLLFDMVCTVANCLLLVLNDQTQHKFRSGNVITGEKRWPQGPDDLLPYGPKDSVLGLELWLSIPPLGYILFRLAGRLALSHVPFAREVFQPPKYTFALILPFRHIQAALYFHEKAGNFSSIQRTHYFDHPVMMIFDFFDNLSRCDLPQYELMFTGQSWLSPILARLSTILAPLPADEWLHTRMKVLYLTAFAQAKFDPVTRAAEIKLDCEQILKEIQLVDDLEPVFIMMIEARRLGCSNISCSSASEIVHSRLCAKCNLIRFCGKECQKEAWNCANLPHKPLCAKIHYVKEALGPDNWSLLWTPDVTYAQFQDMCKTNKVDPNILQQIAFALGSLAMDKSTLHSNLKRAGGSHINNSVAGLEEGMVQMLNIKAHAG